MDIVDLKLEPAHIQTLAEWHQNEWSYLNPQGSLQQRIEKMQSFLGEDLLPSTFIAKQNGLLLGSAAIVMHDMETKTYLSPWLASVFVAPENRCKGVGSKLVSHVVSAVRDADINKIYLFTPDQAGFYKTLGWSVMDHTTYRDHKVTIMERVLKI